MKTFSKPFTAANLTFGIFYQPKVWVKIDTKLKFINRNLSTLF